MRGSDILFSQCRARNSTHLALGLPGGKHRSTIVHSSCWYLKLPVTSFGIGNWRWQLAVAAGSPLRAAGIGAIHRVGLEDLHRLSKMKQLSFHSSERDLHSFSPKLLSQPRNQPHCRLRCLTPTQH